MANILQSVSDFIADLPAKIARAKKAAVPVVGTVIAILAAVSAALPTLVPVVAALIGFATTLGVYKARNAPPT